MARFCTKCGSPLEDGKCSNCLSSGSSAGNLLTNLSNRMGVEFPTLNTVNAVERGKQIVPDVVKPNGGEIPIKQYEVATLRSRIRGQWAKGRLQVTNKRVLFRAAGISYKGRIAQQYEFAIDEIAGIEIKKSNRISGLNLVGALLLNSLVAPLSAVALSDFASNAPFVALLAALVIITVSAGAFFCIKRKFWLKLLILSVGGGAFLGTVISAPDGAGLVLGVAGLVLSLLTWLNIILVSLVPDLVLCVKTKGASEAFMIRRKQFASWFKQEIEHTGFGEVVPGKDVDLMASEIGALIDDIQTQGDMAIDTWKE